MPYITYLTNPLQTNRAAYHAGWGRTKNQSKAEGLYWNNQLPYVRTVPASKAPRWALEEAREAYHAPCMACGRVHPVKKRHTSCIDRQGKPLPVTQSWPAKVVVYEF